MSNIIHESSRGIDLIPLDDRLLAENTVFLTGSVCRENCNEIIKQLMYLNTKPDIEAISIFIDSDGGSVQAGFALYDVIQMISKPVETIVLGQACSMAAIVFLAAENERRFMLPNARIMIHDPSFGEGHDSSGKKPHELQSELDDLNKCRTKLASLIAERTGKSLKEVYKETKDDSFMTVEEAIDFGLCSRIYNINERR